MKEVKLMESLKWLSEKNTPDKIKFIDNLELIYFFHETIDQ